MRRQDELKAEHKALITEHCSTPGKLLDILIEDTT